MCKLLLVFHWSRSRSCTPVTLAASSRKPGRYCGCMCFHCRTRPLSSIILSSACVDQMSPVLWWTSVSNCKCKVSPHLISTALKLLCLPSSSAAIERVFSNFGLVQTKLRNQLGFEKAAKLVTCYRQLRGNVELDSRECHEWKWNVSDSETVRTFILTDKPWHCYYLQSFTDVV